MENTCLFAQNQSTRLDVRCSLVSGRVMGTLQLGVFVRRLRDESCPREREREKEMSVGSWELPGLQVLFSWIVFSFRVQVHLCICNTYQHLVMHSEQGGNYQVIHPFTKSHEFAKSVVQMKRAEEIRP